MAADRDLVSHSARSPGTDNLERGTGRDTGLRSRWSLTAEAGGGGDRGRVRFGGHLARGGWTPESGAAYGACGDRGRGGARAVGDGHGLDPARGQRSQAVDQRLSPARWDRGGATIGRTLERGSGCVSGLRQGSAHGKTELWGLHELCRSQSSWNALAVHWRGLREDGPSGGVTRRRALRVMVVRGRVGRSERGIQRQPAGRRRGGRAGYAVTVYW